MTDESTPETPKLIPHAIYSRNGLQMIAVDEEKYIRITGAGEVTFPATSDLIWVCSPHSTAWREKMVEVRGLIARDLLNEQRELANLRGHLTALGDALRDKAIEKDWCEEYDAFADEWDLPTLRSEWDVSMTVRISARNEEDALEVVKNSVSLSRHNDDEVTDGPEYDVNPAY